MYRNGLVGKARNSASKFPKKSAVIRVEKIETAVGYVLVTVNAIERRKALNEWWKTVKLSVKDTISLRGLFGCKVSLIIIYNYYKHLKDWL